MILSTKCKILISIAVAVFLVILLLISTSTSHNKSVVTEIHANLKGLDLSKYKTYGFKDVTSFLQVHYYQPNDQKAEDINDDRNVLKEEKENKKMKSIKFKKNEKAIDGDVDMKDSDDNPENKDDDNKRRLFSKKTSEQKNKMKKKAFGNDKDVDEEDDDEEEEDNDDDDDDVKEEEDKDNIDEGEDNNDIDDDLKKLSKLFKTSQSAIDNEEEDKEEDRELYITVPEHVLYKPFLIHATYYHGTTDDGDIIEEEHRGSIATDETNTIFHFELSLDNKFLRLVREQHHFRTTDVDMKAALKESTWTGYVAQFPILLTENIPKSFRVRRGKQYTFAASSWMENGFYVAEWVTKLNGGMEFDRQVTKAFHQNTNIVVEYHDTETQITSSILYSLLLLPKNLMKSRIANERVGYFSNSYTHVGFFKKRFQPQTQYLNPKITLIHKHRLETKHYKTKQVKKPITYYIDPTIPRRWWPYFEQGIYAWTEAFKKAGYENAIQVILPTDKKWPKDYEIGDMRYNTLSLFVSDSIFAIAPSIVDPRSGEILHTDIIFSEGWIRVWMEEYETSLKSSERISLSSTSSLIYPRKQRDRSKRRHPFHSIKTSLSSTCQLGYNQQDIDLTRTLANYHFGYVPEEVIGEAIAHTVLHEIGHTLGLRHNFAASTARTIEQLKDSKYMEQYGMASSVMDYIPANIYTNEKLISKHSSSFKKNIFYSIVVGEYDIAAIQYGYQFIPSERLGQTNDELDAIAQSIPLFATDEDSNLGQNPLAKLFDLSNDPISFYIDQIDILHKIRNAFKKKFKQKNSIKKKMHWKEYWKMEENYYNQILQIMNQLHSFIGGITFQQDIQQSKMIINNKSKKLKRSSSSSSSLQIKYVTKKDQLRILNIVCYILAGDDTLFPSPSEYSEYLLSQPTCSSSSNNMESSCYGVAWVNMDEIIEGIRETILKKYLNLDQLKIIVSQDKNANLNIEELMHMILFQGVFKDVLNERNFNLQKKIIDKLLIFEKDNDERIAIVAIEMKLMLEKMIENIILQVENNNLMKIHFEKCLIALQAHKNYSKLKPMLSSNVKSRKRRKEIDDDDDDEEKMMKNL